MDVRGPDPPTPRVAVITGASHGIGAALTTEYRRRGWAVVANARRLEPSPDEYLLTVPGDVTEAATAERIVTQALERFGRIDTLVNNAGVFLSKPFTDYTAQDYAQAVGLNLTAFFRLTQRVVAGMLADGAGHIVTMTTTLAERADSRVPAALTALTKGGLVAATRSLAIEYASRGIRVNAVSPGVIRTATDDPSGLRRTRSASSARPGRVDRRCRRRGALPGDRFLRDGRGAARRRRTDRRIVNPCVRFSWSRAPRSR